MATRIGQEILRGRHISVGGVTPHDWQHRGEGSPPCALSDLRTLSGCASIWLRRSFCKFRWRVAAERRAGLCPSLGLGGCRFLFGEFGWRRRPSYGVSVRRRRAGNTAVMGLRRVLSLRFQAGAIAVFIRWRVAAERRAGLCPSLGLGGCRFLFGEFGWRRRPS